VEGAVHGTAGLCGMTEEDDDAPKNKIRGVSGK
jgi:hypothetical protein